MRREEDCAGKVTGGYEGDNRGSRKKQTEEGKIGEIGERGSRGLSLSSQLGGWGLNGWKRQGKSEMQLLEGLLASR